MRLLGIRAAFLVGSRRRRPDWWPEGISPDPSVPAISYSYSVLCPTGYRRRASALHRPASTLILHPGRFQPLAYVCEFHGSAAPVYFAHGLQYPQALIAHNQPHALQSSTFQPFEEALPAGFVLLHALLCAQYFAITVFRNANCHQNRDVFVFTAPVPLQVDAIHIDVRIPPCQRPLSPVLVYSLYLVVISCILTVYLSINAKRNPHALYQNMRTLLTNPVNCDTGADAPCRVHLLPFCHCGLLLTFFQLNFSRMASTRKSTGARSSFR